MAKIEPLLLKEWLGKYIKVKDLKKLSQQLEQYRLGYVGNSADHISFYGSPYIGLHNIWFTSGYENKLVSGILRLDKNDLLHDLKDVDEEGASLRVPAVYPGRKVSGEWFNLILLYLAHLLKDVKHPTRHNMSASLIPIQIYAYRTLAAVHSNSFRYLGSEAVAKAVYSQLSNKFILKQLKSWDKYIEYRAVATLNLAHDRNTLEMDDDEQGLLLLIVTSNAIRSTFKIMYQLYLDVKDSGGGEVSSTSVKEGEEGTFIHEVVNAESASQALLLKFADSSIIDIPTVKYVSGFVPRVIYGDLLMILKWMSREYLKNKKLVDLFVTSIVAFVVDKLQSSDIRESTSKVELINRLYDAVGSSKTASVQLTNLRIAGLTIVEAATPNRAESYNQRLRGAIILYVIIMLVNQLK